jgi:hypothetical protein
VIRQDSGISRQGVSRRRFVRDGVALAAGATLYGPATSLGQGAGAADTVLRNGRVLTVAGKRIVEAVAVTGAGSPTSARAAARRPSSVPEPR